MNTLTRITFSCVAVAVFFLRSTNKVGSYTYSERANMANASYMSLVPN